MAKVELVAITTIRLEDGKHVAPGENFFVNSDLAENLVRNNGAVELTEEVKTARKNAQAEFEAEAARVEAEKAAARVEAGRAAEKAAAEADAKAAERAAAEKADAGHHDLGV